MITLDPITHLSETVEPSILTPLPTTADAAMVTPSLTPPDAALMLEGPVCWAE